MPSSCFHSVTSTEFVLQRLQFYTFVCVNARQIPSDLKLSPNCIITTLAAERKFTIVNVPMTGGQAYEIVNYWRT